MGYLLELVRALPRAKWVQNTLVSAKRGECWETVTTASSQLPEIRKFNFCMYLVIGIRLNEPHVCSDK